MRRARYAAVFLAILLAFVLALTLHLRQWHPDTKRYPHQGVDVTGYNGPIDWHMLHARGANFAYIRATLSANLRDTRFEENWAAADQAGVARGAIHIFSLCAPAAAQAANFIRTVPRTQNALPAAVSLDFHPGCDARPDRAAMLKSLREFLTLTERATGKPMLLQLSRRFEKHYRVSQAVARPIWVDQPLFAPGYAANGWKIWRASNFRRIAGVSGPINWDVIADDR
ncbi:lysozyme [Stakelama pacifica]|uniref:Lysozyme n=1 Tax=Stakelama pacifica TaxID=517720 RepID=A0A4R6FA39_9SPHN|nr:lysozyme [Stakelama pacifica]